MRNWIRRLLTLVLPALMMMLAASTAEARFGFGAPSYAPAYGQGYGQAYGQAAPNYGYLNGAGAYGSLPSPLQTQSSTGIRGYGSQTGQSWEALQALLGGGQGSGAQVCPFCPRGGGGNGNCPYCTQSAGAQDGSGSTCPYCVGGNCPYCQQNGLGAQSYAAAGDGSGGCPWCVNGTCNCGPNGCNCGPNCNCAGGNCNCPNCWRGQGQIPYGGEQFAQAVGQTQAYQPMQGMPYGI